MPSPYTPAELGFDNRQDFVRHRMCDKRKVKSQKRAYEERSKFHADVGEWLSVYRCRFCGLYHLGHAS